MSRSVIPNLSASSRTYLTSRGADLTSLQYNEHCTPTLTSRSKTVAMFTASPNVSAISALTGQEVVFVVADVASWFFVWEDPAPLDADARRCWPPDWPPSLANAC